MCVRVYVLTDTKAFSVSPPVFRLESVIRGHGHLARVVTGVPRLLVGQCPPKRPNLYC